MALVSCPECDSAVSNFAHSCPHCGCPFQSEEPVKKKGLSAWDKGESFAKIFSLIALPILVAAGGWYFQLTASNNSAKSEYIKIATGILQEPVLENDDLTLKNWAAKTIAKYSEVEFNPEELENLKSGSVLIPAKQNYESFEEAFQALKERTLAVVAENRQGKPRS